MGILNFEVPENNALRKTGYDLLGADWSEAIKATSTEAIIRNPALSIYRYLQLKSAEEDEQSRVFESEDEWRESYYYHPDLSFYEGLNENAAKILYTRKKEEKKRQDIIMRAPKGLFATGSMFATDIITSFIDPINVASAFVPVIGEARFAAMVAKHGKTLARLGRGTVEGLVGAGLIEPIILASSRKEQSDYGMTESLMNVGFGTVFGGGLHVGMGAIGDMMKKARPGTREAALRTSVARLLENREPDIEPILKADDRLNGETPTMNRWEVRQKFKESFEVSDTEVDYAMALIDSRAAIWAEKIGVPSDYYYGEWIAGIERGGEAAEDALFMATKKIDTDDPDWIAGKDHGDMKAAERFAEKNWTKRKTTYAAKKIDNPENTLLISQVGSSGDNRHTIALAKKLSKELGTEYADGDNYFIPLHQEQSKKIPIEGRIFYEREYEPRTGTNIKELKAQAAGKEIILIEDKITTGGSNRAFIQELKKHGITVKDVISYEGYYRKIIYESKLREIQGLFDRKNLDFNAEGLKNKLTDGEAYALIRKLQRTKDGQKELTEKIQGLFNRGPIEDVPAKAGDTHPGRDATGKDISDGKLHSGLQTGPGLSGPLKPTKKTLPEQLKLFQESDDAIRASIEFIEDGRALIRALEKPDITSMLHEIGHLFRKEIGETEPRLLADIEGWAGVKEGKWTKASEERFVSGFMEYLHEGKAPSKTIQGLFDKFRQWLRNIYAHVEDADMTLNDDVRKFFDRILEGDERVRTNPVKKRINLREIGEEIQAKEKAGDNYLDMDPEMKDLEPDHIKPLTDTERGTELQGQIDDMMEDIDFLKEKGMVNEDDMAAIAQYDEALNKTESYRKVARSLARCLI